MLGVETITVDIPAEGGIADACLVVPDGDGPFRGVLLYPDAFGPRPRIREMAGRIAARGYAVLAPNLLYRGGPAPLVDVADLRTPEGRERVIARVMPLADGLTAEKSIRDTGVYLDFLAAQDRVAAEPVAIVGYCMGGTNGLRAAAAYPARIVGLASFHGGRLVTDRPDSPHLGVGKVTGELYFGHAENDHSITAAQIGVLEAALDAAGVPYTSEVYAGAPHGFTMTDTAAHRAAAEQRHWERLFPFLERNLAQVPAGAADVGDE